MSDSGTKATEQKALSDLLVKLWPSLPYMALGVWSAWGFLAYSGSVWLSDSETDGTWLSIFYVASAFSFASVCLAAPFFFKKVKFLLDKRWFLVSSGITTGFGALLVILSGPYYVDIQALFWVGSILTGWGNAFVALKCGELFGMLNPRRSLLAAALSQILAVGLYFMVVAAPVWQLVDNGPGIVGIIAFMTLPVLGGFMASMPARLVDDSFYKNGGSSHDDDHAWESSAEEAEEGPFEGVFAEQMSKLPVAFWKMVVVAGILSAITAMVRSSVVSSAPLDATLDGNSTLMYFRLIVMFSFLYLALRVKSDKFDFGRLYSLLTVALVVSLALVSMVGNVNSVTSAIIFFLSSVLEFIVLCLFAFIVFQQRISPLFVYGFGRGSFMLGNAVGWLAGYAIAPSVYASVGAPVFYLFTAGVVLVLAVVVFSARDFDTLFSPLQVPVDSEESLMVTPGVEHTDDRKGRFGLAVDSISESAGLSTREREVMKYLAMGRGSDFIAASLQVSRNTARTRTHNIYTKLCIHSRQELIDRVDEVMRKDE